LPEIVTVGSFLREQGCILLAESVDLATVIHMRHEGSATVALRSRVGTAAARCYR
jgi:hypothetical protein